MGFVIRIKIQSKLDTLKVRCFELFVVNQSCHQRPLLRLNTDPQTWKILCSVTHTCTNSHGVVVALLFGFEEAHGKEAARLDTQHEYDASYEAGHVELGLRKLRGWVGLTSITLREKSSLSLLNTKPEWCIKEEYAVQALTWIQSFVKPTEWTVYSALMGTVNDVAERGVDVHAEAQSL